ncbi:lipopolysaccharide biosynthesis protein [Arenibacter sp. ARW7G5Y1]|uniref:lipopolysaccharide biosynthesis protein n=1 Tax=Arenibacter sp. ARW7G5Y1 TaxID=2135619 RepID=UPI000D7519DA|nr:oligosaccharide flippase family protein [Arenibacter sp. ARW7G5Y1]PXX27825.1 O-antigen/teichoic acid export membrane protein [Arenibacter sp. ARW7G5Y1]|tara:strand:+ start:16500 stop:17945 length:1446 start_codon:yes stop_codon:yes gene_type:complete
MSKNKIILNSGIYSLLSLLQKGVNFFMVPVLTVYLTTFDYGIVAVVTAINLFLNKLYLLSLDGSINRFYYEYENDKEKIKRLFGTIVTFVLAVSTIFSVIIFLGHKYFIDPFLSDVDFYPYMLLGMVSVFFNPIFTIYQNTLQAQQNGKKYGKQNMMFFIVNICLLLIGVVVLDMGAKGLLGALALTNIIFFMYTLTRFGKEIKFGIDRHLLKESLTYSLPLIPHSISGIATNTIDRLFVNSFLSTASAGIYALGNTFGGIIFLIASGVNQAFVPWFNEQVKSGNNYKIPAIAKLLVLIYSIIALGISYFGKEVIAYVTPNAYHEAWKVIPFISFAFVFHSLYYFFSTPLFYNIKKKGSRVLPIFTVSAAVINITLNYILIVRYGMIGVAIATLITKVLLILALSRIYKKYVLINYPNAIMILLPIVYFGIAMISFYKFGNNELIYKIIIYILVLFLTSLFFGKEIRVIKLKAARLYGQKK